MMMLGGYGFQPSYFTPGFLQGPTMIPSLFDPQGYPIAQLAVPAPISTDYNLLGGTRGLPPKKTSHGGGVISRFHSGGSVGGGGAAAQIHIHNYTDLKTLVKEMATRQGQKMIVDTVKGHRSTLASNNGTAVFLPVNDVARILAVRRIAVLRFNRIRRARGRDRHSQPRRVSALHTCAGRVGRRLLGDTETKAIGSTWNNEAPADLADQLAPHITGGRSMRFLRPSEKVQQNSNGETYT